MVLMHWYDKYSVGSKLIDKQHQKLIMLINELHGATVISKKKEVIERVLIELIQYTKTHFYEEEELMIKAGFPAFDEHVKKHHFFINQLNIFFKQFEDGEIDVSIKLLEFLKKWIIKHIQNADQEYAPYLEKAGLSSPES